MVSYRAKKKLADRTCMYCEKEFTYPSILKRHLKLKNMCSEQSSQVNDRVSLVSDQISPTSDRVSSISDQISLTSNQVSLTTDQISEKNMVPIRLTLV